MKNRFRISICLILTLWFATSCDQHIVYYSYQSTPQTGWEKSDTLFFNVDLKDSLTSLHLSAEVRNENNYPYRNLFLIVCQNLEDSTSWQTDTLEYILANKEAKWIGTGQVLYQSTLPLKAAVARHPGNFTFKIIHGMKDTKISGIRDVGIKISKKEPR